MDWDLEKISYVYVELVSNKKVIAGSATISTMSDVIAGLFAGIKIVKKEDEDKTDILISVQDNKKVSHALSIDEYTIMSISKLSGDVKKMAFFRCEDPDQSKAFEMLEDTAEALAKQNRTVGSSAMINVESYDNLPEEFTEDTKKPIVPVTSHCSNTYNRHTGNHNTHYHERHTPYVDTTKKVRYFRRKTAKPTEDALTKLRAMITLISEGKEDIKIPIVKCDIPPEDEREAVEGTVWQNYDSYI